MPYSVLLPSFAGRQLGGGPHTFSSLQAAVGLGAMIAAFGLAVRSRVAGLERWLVVAGAAFGVLLVALSRATSLPLALVILCLSAAASSSPWRPPTRCSRCSLRVTCAGA